MPFETDVVRYGTDPWVTSWSRSFAKLALVGEVDGGKGAINMTVEGAKKCSWAWLATIGEGMIFERKLRGGLPEGEEEVCVAEWELEQDAEP